MMITTSTARRRQSGIALVVVLIMLLLVTALGIAAVRTLIMQERMASNGFDRNLAMQSAERTLRLAEDIARAQSLAQPINPGFPADPLGVMNGNYAGSCPVVNGTDSSPCAAGLCSQPTPACAPRWTDTSFDASWVTVTSTVPAIASSAALDSDSKLSLGLQQQYLIEFLGKTYPCSKDPGDKQNCSLYRITVRTNKGSNRAVVQLQSNYLAQTKI